MSAKSTIQSKWRQKCKNVDCDIPSSAIIQIARIVEKTRRDENENARVYPLKKQPTMATAAPTTMTNPIENATITVDDDDDDASIDEEQLEEYREMVEQLGDFPVS
jgi:hypothetical protein